ncbi:hypothetical protein [Alicyclobacillus fodiniaquatilis]|uniref:Uncharacterized protein n=1 Tax=Alicyclobacillus fodiniaquatilis TaxID=1661150 RepID=A0ABW4JD38_9BACL
MKRILSPTFAIGTIRIGQIEGASCLNMGNNWPTNFRSTKKHTQGFGTVSGDHNTVREARSLLNDSDVIDTLSLGDEPTPDWFMNFVKKLSDESDDQDSIVRGDSRKARRDGH